MIWCDFIAGWVGGCAGLLVGHPFDTLKVCQQTQKHQSLYSTLIFCCKNEGVRGLFKGMYYPLLSAGALNSLFFGVYGFTLKTLTEARNSRNLKDDKNKPVSYNDIFWAGCAGGAAQLIVACPIDLVKIRLQTQAGQPNRHDTPYSILRKIYYEKGFRGWYKGMIPMAWRDVPSFGLYILIYQWIFDQFFTSDEREMSNLFHTVWIGGLAGVLSWFTVIHLDVIKSRIQADCDINPRYNGMLDCIRQSYREGGLRVFSRGILVLSLRAFPLNGATFIGYEYCLDGCRRFNQN